MPMYEVKIRVTNVQVLNIEAENEAEAESRAYDETPYDTYDEDPEVKAELVND